MIEEIFKKKNNDIFLIYEQCSRQILNSYEGVTILASMICVLEVAASWEFESGHVL